MDVGRFLAGVGALIWEQETNKYFLLRRVADRDFQAGAWECVTGRVDQGESFEEALHREVMEEIGGKVQIEFIVATTHFYRGEAKPENELLGLIYGCSALNPAEMRVVLQQNTACRNRTSPDQKKSFNLLKRRNASS